MSAGERSTASSDASVTPSKVSPARASKGGSPIKTTRPGKQPLAIKAKKSTGNGTTPTKRTGGAGGRGGAGPAQKSKSGGDSEEDTEDESTEDKARPVESSEESSDDEAAAKRARDKVKQRAKSLPMKKSDKPPPVTRSPRHSSMQKGGITRASPEKSPTPAAGNRQQSLKERIAQVCCGLSSMHHF
jgi:hypothetical protein